MKYLYLVLAVIGFVVPYYFFLAFLFEYEIDLQIFIEFLFANPISTFFALDLIMATLAFFVFLYQESHRLDIDRWWLYVIFSLIIGLSFALPLFLYTREAKLGQLDNPG